MRFFHFFSVAIDLILFKLTCNKDIQNILDELNFSQFGSLTVELAALERLKTSP